MIAPEETDEHLVARVGTGDRAAFARLVGRHRGRVAALAARMVGEDAADDIAQETFLRAWIKAPSWVAQSQGGAARFTTWLARIAINLAIDRLRRRPDLPLESVAEAPDPGRGAEQAMLAREQDALVVRAIAGLPERQRAAIALTYDHALSNSEGAAALGISVGAFELLLVRARRTLRRSLRVTMEDAA